MNEKVNSRNLRIGHEVIDKWHGLELDYEPDDLIDVPLKYRALGAEVKDLRLRTEVLSSFIDMVDHGESDGVIIKLVSAYRSAAYQQILYDKAKAKSSGTLPDTAEPGHSEHQLGTVVDLSTPELDYGLTEAFSETEAYQWIVENAHRFGFYISYDKENHIQKGYIWEPWHLRYWADQVPK